MNSQFHESWAQMVPCFWAQMVPYSWAQMVPYSWAQIVPNLSWHKNGHYTERGKWRKRRLKPPYSSKMTDQLRNISTHSENIRIYKTTRRETYTK